MIQVWQNRRYDITSLLFCPFLLHIPGYPFQFGGRLLLRWQGWRWLPLGRPASPPLRAHPPTSFPLLSLAEGNGNGWAVFQREAFFVGFQMVYVYKDLFLQAYLIFKTQFPVETHCMRLLKVYCYKGKLFIYDISGRIVKEAELNDGIYSIELNTSNLTNGLYLVSIQHDGVPLAQEKLIIRH